MSEGSQAHRRSRADETDVRRRAWRTLLETTTALRALLDVSLQRREGLELLTYDALLHTYEAGAAGLRMSELAERIVLSKSGLTTLVDRLEARGLLRRSADPSDRRALRITLTEHGLAVFRRAARTHVGDIHALLGVHLSDDEARTMTEILDRIRQRLATPPAPAQP